MIVVLTLALAIGSAAVAPGNMNGDYLIGNPNVHAKTQYSTDYASRNAEFFDVYSPPVRTVYGEVFWCATCNRVAR